VGPNDLVTSSPELLAHMSAVRSRYTRTKWYNRATRHRPGKDHVFSELDEEKHMRRRQQMAAGVGRPLPGAQREGRFAYQFFILA
jgi:hypothetical protein